MAQPEQQAQPQVTYMMAQPEQQVQYIQYAQPEAQPVQYVIQGEAGQMTYASPEVTYAQREGAPQVQYVMQAPQTQMTYLPSAQSMVSYPTTQYMPAEPMAAPTSVPAPAPAAVTSAAAKKSKKAKLASTKKSKGCC
mmetsp:Transcript_119344/g.166528  ORF Transcript_119344/g.166528 Transcript_119344/m.166528 type:complete len:137 (-) Transcript_119344:12-422(-)